MSAVAATTIRVPGHRAEMIAACKAAIARVHDEPGVALYALHEEPASAPHPLRIVPAGNGLVNPAHNSEVAGSNPPG